jgi:hypothetical protein
VTRAYDPLTAHRLWRCRSCPASFDLFTDREDHELWDHGIRAWVLRASWTVGLLVLLYVVVTLVRR